VGKWPVLVLLCVLVVAVLYYVTPNVKHVRLRWVSYGAILAIVGWGVATIGFAVYVSTVASYDRIYGWLGGAIVLLLWLYLTNLVLVFGAEADAEIVRVRQLAAGVAAEEVVRLPARDTRRTRTLDRQRAADLAEGRKLRTSAEHDAS
jgi:membrane protein